MMKLQRFKKDSNIILDKPKFQSSKKKLMMSTLSLAGGLILTNISQNNIVKADTVSNVTPIVQSTQITTEQEKVVEGQPDNTTNSEQNGNDVDSGTGSLESDSKLPKNESNFENTDSMNKKNLGLQTSAGTDNEKVEFLSQSTSAISNDPSNQQLKGDNANVESNTPEWNLNEDGTILNISSGTFTNSDFSNVNEAYYNPYWTTDQQKNVTKIIINGPVTMKGDVSGLFNAFSILSEIDGLENIDTSQATSLNFLFGRCQRLHSININSWDVSNVQDFSSMFYQANSLTEIDISSWNLSHGTNFSNMFNYMDKLSELYLPQAINSNATTNARFDFMFNSMISLKSLDISNLDMTDAASSSLIFINEYSMSKLKLSPKNNLSESFLKLNSDLTDSSGRHLVAWKATASDDSKVKAGTILSPEDLVKLYSNPEKRSGSTTWEWDYEDPIKFKVIYVASDDPTKVFYTTPELGPQLPYTKYNVPAFSDLGVTPNVSTDGYFTEEQAQIMLTKDMNNGVALVKLQKEQIMIQIEEKNKTSNGSVDIISIPVSAGQTISETDFFDQIAQLDNDRKIVLSDDDFKTGSYMEISSEKENVYFPVVTDNGTDIQSIVKNTFDSILGMAEIDEKSPIPVELRGYKFTFHLIYQPEDNTENNNNSSSGGSTSINREIEGIEERVATYADNPSVQLYDDYGDTIADRKLVPNSDWYTDESMQLNGVKYYRVATDQWVKASDVYLYYPHASKVKTKTYAQLLTAKGDAVTDRELSPNSNWYTDKYIYINNIKYYRVATNEFVSANQVQEY